MFERFTKSARAAVIESQLIAREALASSKGVARDAGAASVSGEHLLLALRRSGGEVGAFLRARLPDEDVLRAEFALVRRRGGITDVDADALDALGIDVDSVVRAVEHAHGEYALAGSAERPRRWPRFGPEAKRAVGRSLREAKDHGDRYLGEHHLLLALLRGPGPTADVLARQGIDYVSVRALGNG